MAATNSAFESLLTQLSADERQLIERALQTARQAHANQTRKDGSPYINHPVAVALILAEWGADAETIAAGLLHDAIEDSDLMREAIAKQFGDTVGNLVEGVTKITETDLLERQQEGPEGQLTLNRKTETLRKLFDVMRQDIRALVIKLADRVHNVRTIERLDPDRRVRFAKETLDIYYKLAYHLGMNDVRREFSERCVPIVYPEAGAELIALRKRKLEEMQERLPTMERQLREEDRSGAIESLRLEGHSLVSLLHDRVQPDFSEDQTVYLVVITTDEEGCYTALKNLHAIYHPRSALFRDYIASPARSGYRSLHTTVADEKGRIFDVRIRTALMDADERLGILRHCFGESWEGKEFEWLQRTAAFDWATRESSAAFLQALQSDILEENITVMADGKELQIASNATVLDVLYARYGKRANHVAVVHRNGAPAFLGDHVKEDDVVLAALDAKENVQFEWLGYATSAYARTLIVEALKKRSREEKTAIGLNLLQKEFDHYRKGYIGDLSRADQEKIARHFGRARFEDVLVMIGEGLVSPGDVVAAMTPRRRTFRVWPHKPEGRRWFQLHVTGAHLGQQEILPRLASVAQQAKVDIRETNVRFNDRGGTYTAIVRGRAANQSQLADFLSALDRAEWTSNVYAMLSHLQRILLGCILIAAAAVVVFDILLLPTYERILAQQTMLPLIMLEVLPLLPILGVNFYLLKLLRQYSVRLRQERWFLGLGFFINMATLVLLIAQNAYTGLRGHLLPILAIVVISIVYTAVRFFQTQVSLMPSHQQKHRSLTAEEWRARYRQKKIGYLIRLAAVIVWGLDPIYIRYTDANNLSPFLRTFLLSIGVLLFSSLALAVKYAITKPKKFSIPYDRFFALLIVGQISLMYFKNASLLYTSGTNFLLFGNFSPVLGLVVAATFWRSRIPYLREPKHMLWIFLLAMIGSFGSALLFYNSLTTSPASIVGDLLAIIAVFSDLILVVGQIEYIKRHMQTDGLVLNMHIFSVVLLVSAPLVFLLHASGYPVLEGLNTRTLLLGMGIGLFVGCGQYLNYEAFKRIDGYLAFMMFNLSVVITFGIEAFVLDTLQATLLLILSAALIIGSTVVAEIINSRCERRDYT